MSITNRLLDAAILYKQGRHEGALLSVLVAVAGTSRLRFPKDIAASRRDPSKKMGDGEAFETFLTEEMVRVGACSVLFNGECHSAEKLFYKWLRCTLAHEAGLPPDVVFLPGASDCVASIQVVAGSPEQLMITHPIVLLLADLVANAPENRNVPEEVKRALRPS